MSLSKEDLKDRLESLIKDLQDASGAIEGLAVADAARVENALLGAYNAVRSFLEAGEPKVGVVSDPGFDRASKNTEAVANGEQPNVHPVTGETVPPGSTEGVRPEGTVDAPAAAAGVPEQNPERRTGDANTPEPELNAGDPVRGKDQHEAQAGKARKS